MTTPAISRRTALLSFGAFAALAGCSSSTIRRTRDFTPTFPQTRALMDAFVAEGRLPNAVARIKVGAFAQATLKAGTLAFDDAHPADERTLFRAYSMTKPVTGFAAMLLIEDGALTLDQPLAEIFPEFANMQVLVGDDLTQTRPASAPILVRHLLTHTAGFSYTILSNGPLPRLYRRHGLFAAGRALPYAEEGDGAPPATLAEFAQRLAQLPLAFDPGARWQYSVGLDVLGAVIERVAGEPFDAFLQRRIFAPLRMLDTAFYVPSSKLDRFTSNYFRTDEGPQKIDERASSPFAEREGVPYGGAGLVSTADDYARFAAMLLNGGALDGVRIASRDTVTAATSNLLPENASAPDLQGASFGAGLSTATPASARAGQRPAGSYSWAGAAGTLFWVDPANDAYVVFMTQVMNENDRIWAPLQEAVYSDLAAMPQLQPDRVEPLNRPPKYY